jgi:hypothetical protein
MITGVNYYENGSTLYSPNKLKCSRQKRGHFCRHLEKKIVAVAREIEKKQGALITWKSSLVFHDMASISICKGGNRCLKAFQGAENDLVTLGDDAHLIHKQKAVSLSSLAVFASSSRTMLDATFNKQKHARASWARKRLSMLVERSQNHVSSSCPCIRSRS